MTCAGTAGFPGAKVSNAKVSERGRSGWCGQSAESYGDAGQDLVPESKDQVEATEQCSNGGLWSKGVPRNWPHSIGFEHSGQPGRRHVLLLHVRHESATDTIDFGRYAEVGIHAAHFNVLALTATTNNCLNTIRWFLFLILAKIYIKYIYNFIHRSTLYRLWLEIASRFVPQLPNWS